MKVGDCDEFSSLQEVLRNLAALISFFPERQLCKNTIRLIFPQVSKA